MAEVPIRLAKCWIILTRDELQQMLRAFPTIWESAIRRGKYYARVEKEQWRRVK